MIDASHEAYVARKLPRAPEKGFGFGDTSRHPRKADGVFTAWGTRVRSEEGTVAVPEEKRLGLIVAAVLALRGPVHRLATDKSGIQDV